MAADQGTRGNARVSPPIPSTSGALQAAASSTTSSSGASDLGDSACIIGADPISRNEHSLPTPNLLDVDHDKHKLDLHPTIRSASPSPASADDIVTLLRAFRHSRDLSSPHAPVPPFGNPDCEIVERHLSWVELGRVVHRLGLETDLSFGPLGETAGTPPVDSEEYDLGSWVNGRCRWEYSVDQRFRIRMAKTALHWELQDLVTSLVHERVTDAADRLRANCEFEHPPPILLSPKLEMPVRLRNCPKSPGSDDRKSLRLTPDGIIRYDKVGKPPFIDQIGFSHQPPDRECKAYMSYGKAKAVLVVNVDYITKKERMRGAFDPDTVPVEVKLFRLVEMGPRGDAAVATALSTPDVPIDVLVKARQVAYFRDVPGKAPRDVADAQVGIRLADVYRNLPETLPVEAEVELTCGDIWACVKETWREQIKADREEEEDGSGPDWEYVDDGKKRAFVLSPSPDSDEEREEKRPRIEEPRRSERLAQLGHGEGVETQTQRLEEE